MEYEQCPPLTTTTTTTKEQQQPENSLTLSPENSLTRKNIVVNCKSFSSL